MAHLRVCSGKRGGHCSHPAAAPTVATLHRREGAAAALGPGSPLGRTRLPAFARAPPYPLVFSSGLPASLPPCPCPVPLPPARAQPRTRTPAALAGRRSVAPLPRRPRRRRTVFSLLFEFTACERGVSPRGVQRPVVDPLFAPLSARRYPQGLVRAKLAGDTLPGFTHNVRMHAPQAANRRLPRI